MYDKLTRGFESLMVSKMFIGKINLILFTSGISSTGVTRQEIKYNILSILSRANKILSLDDINLNKRNTNNNINLDNLKHIKPVSNDFTIYEPYFDFIFVGNWDNPVISEGTTYFGITESRQISFKNDDRYNVVKVYNNHQMIFVNNLDIIEIQDYFKLLEEDIRDYNINKIINL